MINAFSVQDRAKREITKIDTKFLLEKLSKDPHNQYTPYELCEEILSKAEEGGADLNGDVLVVANIEFVWLLSKHLKDLSRVCFSTPCEYKKKVAIKLGLKEENVYGQLLEAESMRQFDFIVMNPPYKQGLHMKFLDKAFDLLKETGELICVHPSTNFVSLKDSNTNKKIIEKIKNHIKSLWLFNGNTLFNAMFSVPLSVTHLIKNKTFKTVCVRNMDDTVDQYDSLNQVNLFGNKREIFSLLEKISKAAENDNILNHRLKKGQSLDFNYYVNFVGMRGNILGSNSKCLLANDFYTLFHKNLKPTTYLKEIKDSILSFGFNSEIEATNFIAYLKTNFARRAFSFTKINTSLFRNETKIIPWLDFTQEWSDEKLFKYFELNQQEINFVNQIPQYY